MDSNDKIKAVGINIQEKANLIWNVANSPLVPISLTNTDWLSCRWHH